MLFKKILVPYDESKPSKEALEKAMGLAKVTDGAMLFILHVVPQIPIPPLFNRSIRSINGEAMTIAEYYKEIYQELKAAAKKKLENVEKKCEKNGVETEVHILSGNPAYRIVQFAKEERIELIIMGSRYADSSATSNDNRSTTGRSKRIVRRMLLKSLGSVSNSVADRAPCPILLIRP